MASVLTFGKRKAQDFLQFILINFSVLQNEVTNQLPVGESQEVFYCPVGN